MYWKLTASEEFHLMNAVGSAIRQAFRNIAESEPQLIANLVESLPRNLNAMSLASGRKLEVGGIFVHAKPFVSSSHFPNSNAVEIGDILLIRTVKSRTHVVERRALLLQAKKIAALPATPDNLNQHVLYARWPEFQYVYARSGLLNGKRRHVRGPGLYSGAKYLLINTTRQIRYLPFHRYTHSGRCYCGVTTAEPFYPDLSAYRCFFIELIDFITGNSGRPFVNPPPKKTRGWDRVIEDLVHQTAKSTSAFMKSAGATGGFRGSGKLFLSGSLDVDVGCLAALAKYVSTNASGEDPPRTSEDMMKGGEGEGISIVEFVVTNDEIMG